MPVLLPPKSAYALELQAVRRRAEGQSKAADAWQQADAVDVAAAGKEENLELIRVLVLSRRTSCWRR